MRACEMTMYCILKRLGSANKGWIEALDISCWIEMRIPRIIISSKLIMMAIWDRFERSGWTGHRSSEISGLSRARDGGISEFPLKRFPVRISAWGMFQCTNKKDNAINWPRCWISLRGLKHIWSSCLNTYRVTIIITSLAYSFEAVVWIHVTHLYGPDKLFRSHPKGHLQTQLTITKCWYGSIARTVSDPIWEDR